MKKYLDFFQTELIFNIYFLKLLDKTLTCHSETKFGLNIATQLLLCILEISSFLPLSHHKNIALNV